MKLTDEQLAKIRKRAEAATDGPWLETDGGYVIDSDSEIVIVECESEINATFIAESRTDVPAMLDMIAELQWYVNAQGKRLDRAEHLLMKAQGVMDSTEAWSEINRYLYGEDDDE